MLKRRCVSHSRLTAFGAGFVLAITTSATSAQEIPIRPRRPTLLVDSGLELYLPTHAGRSVDSVFANCTFGVQLLRGILALEAGLTATGAWGDITQWDENFHDVRYHTAVAGVGPIFLIRVEPFHVSRFALSLDLLGGIVVYNGAFPPGGDIYNFTWRLGGAFVARVTQSLSFTWGLRWMHVSNGQGLGPQNPSYEGVGIPFELVYRF